MTSKTISSNLHPALYQAPTGHPVLHTTTDAAEYLGVSVSAVRHHLRSHGVRVGRTVSGMVELSSGSRTGYVPVTSR